MRAVTLFSCVPIILGCLTVMGQEIRPIPPADHPVIRDHAVDRATGSKQPLNYVQPNDKIFPHLATGGGWETVIVVVNLSDSAVDYNQYFYDTAGKPLAVTFRTIPDDRIVTSTGTDTHLPPGATLSYLLYDQGGPLVTGWSVIAYDSANVRLGGYAIFRQRNAGRPDFEALVPLSGFDDDEFVMPFDNTAGSSTAMAIVNPGGTLTSNVTAIVRDVQGRTIGTGTISLGPQTQQSFLLADKFPVTAGKIGSIRFSGSTNRLTGLGFRFNSAGSFATIPILNWSGMFSQ